MTWRPFSVSFIFRSTTWRPSVFYCLFEARLGGLHRLSCRCPCWPSQADDRTVPPPHCYRLPSRPPLQPSSALPPPLTSLLPPPLVITRGPALPAARQHLPSFPPSFPLSTVLAVGVTAKSIATAIDVTSTECKVGGNAYPFECPYLLALSHHDSIGRCVRRLYCRYVDRPEHHQVLLGRLGRGRSGRSRTRPAAR
jgi:hypothetical protein